MSYIKREDVLDAVLFALAGTGEQSKAIYAVKDVPTADVEEVRHGEWEFEVYHFFDDYGDLNAYATAHCSKCENPYPFNPTIAREYVSRPDNLVGYEKWDIDVEPIKGRVAHQARTNKNLFPYCPNCGAKMDGGRSENGT